MTDDMIAARLASELPRWRYEAGALQRLYRTAGWPETLLVVGAIAHLAEAAWHHPDLQVGFDRVAISLRTHDANAVTDTDFALAAAIERTVLWQPPGGGTGRPARYLRDDA